MRFTRNKQRRRAAGERDLRPSGKNIRLIGGRPGPGADWPCPPGGIAAKNRDVPLPSPALDSPPAADAPAPARRPAAAGAPVALTLLVLWGVLCWRLADEWSISEQYAYGWLVPFLALALFGLRWESRPTVATSSVAPPVRLALLLGGGALLFFLLPVRLFENANPDWRLLGWLHAGTVAGLTLLWLTARGGTAWLRHFAFPIGFFFVAVPWIKSHEELVVQSLMRFAAAAATDGLGVLGIPAQLEGSLIRVSTGVVGVNEACSGVRGLQTSLMIGLLLGELQRLPVWRRVALVLLAATLALTANIVRACILVWLAARHGLGAAERGHDVAGYTILGVVFVGTLLLAAWLKPRGPAPAPATGDSKSGVDPAPNAAAFLPAPDTNDASVARPGITPVARPLRPALFVAALAWLGIVEAGVEGWYRWHERGLVARPQWTVRWPAAAPGFRELSIDERTRWLLHFDEGRAASWRLSFAGRRLAWRVRRRITESIGHRESGGVTPAPASAG